MAENSNVIAMVNAGDQLYMTKKNIKVTGMTIPAHHITEVLCERKVDVLFSSQWGPGVSKHPFVAFNLKGISEG